ncbi:MAG: right-handed parallel beta-helix repeat-containing protein [Euryarchaeota archaeon]|nr:right-handed parallel beta-helix repeat-containing protein [Euryarchaeota archaeon]
MIDTAEYVVSTDGDDSNDGSESAPLATVHEAVSRVEAGESIYIHGGQYQYENGNPVEIETSGSESEPITISGDPNDYPHLQWEGGSSEWEITGGLHFIESADPSNWVVENLEISECSSVAIRSHSGENCVFRNLDLHDNGNSGIHVKGANHVMRNIESYNNHDPATGGEDADGIVMSGVSGGEIRDCLCYNNSDDGIDLWGSSDVIVRDTVCHSNGYDSNGDGNGFKSSNTNEGGNNTFIRCVGYNNSRKGIRCYSNQPDTVINFTAYGNDGDGIALSEGGDHEIYNSISYDNGNEDFDQNSGVSSEANTWDLGISDPEFASTDPSSSEFLRLSSTSPCIDAGTRLSVEYSGDAPDLGAYEYGTSGDSGGSDSSEWGPVGVYYHDGTGFVEMTIKST